MKPLKNCRIIELSMFLQITIHSLRVYHYRSHLYGPNRYTKQKEDSALQNQSSLRLFLFPLFSFYAPYSDAINKHTLPIIFIYRNYIMSPCKCQRNFLPSSAQQVTIRVTVSHPVQPRSVVPPHSKALMKRTAGCPGAI